MITVTLLEKMYANLSSRTTESYIQSLCKGLNVAVKVAASTERRWIRVNVSGEDEIAASSLLKEEFSLAPVNVKNIKKDTVYGGKIVFSGKSNLEIFVDIGVFLPEPMDAAVPLQHIQAQLVDGRKMPLRRVIQLFCFLDNLPTEVLVKRIDDQQKRFVAEFSEKQIAIISCWICSNLERLIVLGTFQENVEKAIKTSGHFRDVVAVERLGMLEHAVICKLGTNAVGLIPKIGRLLPDAVLGIFSPKKILRFVKI